MRADVLSGGAAYDAVAALYDGYWGQEFFEVAKAAFDSHLLPVLAEGSEVLDLCCGTGLMLAHLDHRGFRASGVDESAAMLGVARSHAPRAQLHHADMAGFSSDVRFAAVVSFYNSVNHARSIEHLRATFVNVAEHMTGGAFLLFDYVLPEAFESGWEWCEQIDAAGGVWNLRYNFDKSSGQATCWINQSVAIRQMAFGPEEIRHALDDAGLPVVRETAMGESLPNAGRVLVLAVKPVIY